MAGFRYEPGNEPLARAGLYVATHVESGRRYVGISRNVKRRLIEHRRTRQGGEFQKWVKRYGPSAFVVVPVFYLLVDPPKGDRYLPQAERQWIAELGAAVDGLNTLQSSGVLGPMDDGFSRRISRSKSELYADPATRQRLVDSFLASVSTPQARANYSTSRKAMWDERPEMRARYAEMARERFTGPGNPNFGKPLPDAVKAKMSAAKKGKPSPLRGRKLSAETRAKISASRRAKSVEV